ncbi:uncharacterized protein LOC109522649 isoform X2 [Hippocampus comes]|uniref:uncharacterized protein LOC109522649 isoform X2 n=1 Tax=Hippocampus comes TaxID=109280 RepID=UPI00094E1FC2|nr:PREDICTED: uncharacterized protein LOC109522649 isoform X2 [Hippocampus comes]
MIQSYFEATVRMPDYTTVSETPPCGKQLSPMLSCSCGKLRRSPVSVSDRPMNKRGLLSVPPHLGTLQDETNGESQHRSIKDGHLKDFAEEAEMLRDCPFSSAQPHNDIVTSASIRNAMSVIIRANGPSPAQPARKSLRTASCFPPLSHRQEGSLPLHLLPPQPSFPLASVGSAAFPGAREGPEGSMNKSLRVAPRLCDHRQPVPKHASPPPLSVPQHPFFLHP